MTWHSEAACRDVDPEVFFPQVGRSGRPARAICARCPVKAPCLEEILAMTENKDQCGIRGGTSSRERRKLRAARKAAS
jgi:WhiB family redox-sensing transcriptional regulator